MTHDLIYVSCTRVDWESVQEDDDAPRPHMAPNGVMPAALLPRVGDFIYSDKVWWRVERIVWSMFKNYWARAQIAKLGGTLDPEWSAWVDVTLSLVVGDPRT